MQSFSRNFSAKQSPVSPFRCIRNLPPSHDSGEKWHIYRRQVLSPAEQRRYADEGSHQPDGGDHGDHVLHRTFDGVLERASDDEIAIDADRAEIQYRRRAEQHVQRRVGVTHGAVQRPVTGNLPHTTSDILVIVTEISLHTTQKSFRVFCADKLRSLGSSWSLDVP